ncbi:MAG: ABC transporter permease [Pseudomonadota bacterium]
MLRYFIRRLIHSIPVLFGITIISFIVIQLAPGTPIGLTLDPKASPAVIEQMAKNYDLDKPLPTQYWLWLKRLCTGKLYSFKDGKPVLAKIAERLPATLILNLVATLIVFSIAIPLGVFSATHRNSLADNLATFGAYLGISIPSFWLAYLLILATVKLFGYPVLGIRSFALGDIGFTKVVLDYLWHLMLPSIVLAVGGIAAVSRYTRSSMFEALSQDYVRTARAKGLSDDVVYYKHALRNALLPIVTIVGFLVPSLISGSVIIETVFAWPGIGRLAYQSVLARDYSVVMTILTLSSGLTLIGNILSDVLYAMVDPRIRY